MRVLILLLCLFSWPALADCVREFKTLERGVNRDRIWVDRVFAEAGCRLNVLPAADRILDRWWSLKTGQTDLLSAATPLPERSEFAWFSVPYTQEKVVLVVHRAEALTLKIDNMADLMASQRTVIGPHFGYYGPEWEAAKPQLQQLGRFLSYKKWKDAREMLWQKPEQVLLTVEDSALEIVARPKPALVILPTVLYQADLVLMFSRKTVTVEEVELINAAIARLLVRGVSPHDG